MILLSLLASLWINTAQALPSSREECRNQTQSVSLREHMVCLSLHVDQAFSLIGVKDGRRPMADEFEQVRLHLEKTVSLRPRKFSGLNELDLRRAALNYHLIQAQTLVLVAQIETLLLNQDAKPDEFNRLEQNPQAKELLLRLQTTIGKAHQMFR